MQVWQWHHLPRACACIPSLHSFPYRASYFWLAQKQTAAFLKGSKYSFVPPPTVASAIPPLGARPAPAPYYTEEEKRAQKQRLFLEQQALREAHGMQAGPQQAYPQQGYAAQLGYAQQHGYAAQPGYGQQQVYGQPEFVQQGYVQQPLQVHGFGAQPVQGYPPQLPMQGYPAQQMQMQMQNVPFQGVPPQVTALQAASAQVAQLSAQVSQLAAEKVGWSSCFPPRRVLTVLWVPGCLYWLTPKSPQTLDPKP